MNGQVGDLLQAQEDRQDLMEHAEDDQIRLGKEWAPCLLYTDQGDDYLWGT